MTNITKANVDKYGRNQEGTLLDATIIAAKFIGAKTHTERHVKRASAVIAAIQRGGVNRAKYLAS
jgi:hypothetical protein